MKAFEEAILFMPRTGRLFKIRITVKFSQQTAHGLFQSDKWQ